VKGTPIRPENTENIHEVDISSIPTEYIYVYSLICGDIGPFARL
jgi:hypothetical protein